MCGSLAPNAPVSHALTSCPQWVVVRDRLLRFGAGRPVDLEGTVAIMVASDKVKNACVNLMARRQEAHALHMVQGMFYCIDRLGLVKQELTWKFASVLACRCKTTLLTETAT